MQNVPDSELTVVCFALEAESGALVKKLARRQRLQKAGFALVHGWLDEREILVIHTGVGVESVHRMLDAGLFAAPKCLISAGFAGALVPELKRLQVVCAESFLLEGDSVEVQLGTANSQWEGVETQQETANSQQKTVNSQRKTANSQRAVVETQRGTPSQRKPTNREQGMVSGYRLLTSQRILGTLEERQAAHLRYMADVVDMETFVLAEHCRQHAIPFHSVRVISDTVDRTLSPELQHLCSQRTFGAQLWAAIRLICRHPSKIGELRQLQKTASEGSQVLAKAVAGWYDR